VINFLPDSATFVAAILDPRFALGVAISILAGLVRGFSGFGSALVYVPLMSALYGPRLATTSLAVIDVLTAVTFVPTVWRKAVWRDVFPLAAAALVAAQFGSLILKYADPIALRWFITALVLTVVVVLASGWRYHGRPILIVTLGVGALSGLLGSAVQMAGPPVIVYWLGSASEAMIVRANFIAYFAVLATGLGVTYSIKGLLTSEATALALLIGPLQIVMQHVGTRLFHLASERTYRIIAYGVILLAALVSMPLLDRLYR
jgi:uncharacterized membrane protein YfcA